MPVLHLAPITSDITILRIISLKPERGLEINDDKSIYSRQHTSLNREFCIHLRHRFLLLTLLHNHFQLNEQHQRSQ